jgi:glyoxylase-like metal-dependent hydrolase (beta-lactamase superfamily II)
MPAPSNRPVPERKEVFTGIWRLPLPLIDNGLNHINSYLVKGGSADGHLLIDCGWDTPDSREAFDEHLSFIGVEAKDISRILVTHVHPDHFGMAGHLQKLTGAQLSIHRVEQNFIESRYQRVEGLVGEMDEWLRSHGAPVEDAAPMAGGSQGMIGRVGRATIDNPLVGGEQFVVGEFSFNATWTPGHSGGHVCLYDAGKKVLFSGDHVLERITPIIGLHAQSMGNPLADFLDSLRMVGALQADIVLPGHGTEFTDIAKRCDELIEHHEERMAEIATLLQGAPLRTLTNYQLTESMKWARGKAYSELSRWERRLAMTEVIAHTELMHARGRVRKNFVGGVAWYELAG